jgi:ketosteroid isomerase-like protein
VSELVDENDRACAIVDYVYINSKGERMKQPVAELWRTKDEKLTELTVYFDLTAYRHFMQD